MPYLRGSLEELPVKSLVDTGQCLEPSNWIWLLVADISNEWLLGLDFLQAHGMAIDFAQGMVNWAGEHLATHCRQGPKRGCWLKISEDILAVKRMLNPGMAP